MELGEAMKNKELTCSVLLSGKLITMVPFWHLKPLSCRSAHSKVETEVDK